MKKQSPLILILIAALFCLNCQTKTQQEDSANYQGFMYGFVIRGGLDDPTTGAAIDLQEGMDNDTLYVFDQAQGDQKIRLSVADVIFFAETINNAIVQGVTKASSNSADVNDGTKVILYKRNHSFRVNVQIQIVNDIKTELPSLDSLIKHIQGKGAKLNY